MTTINVGIEDVGVDVNVVGERGPQGIQGIQGIQGPAGTPGSSYVHVHHQSVLASVWDIAHNMNKHPAVTVEDGGGTTIYGTVAYIDDNRLTVTFASNATGRANCT